MPSAPQTSHIFARDGAGFFAITNVFPLPSLLRRCVRGVGRFGSFLVDFPAEIHSACATHSAIGATARAQVEAVPESCLAKDPISLQFPFLCSKNQSRLRG